MSIGKKGFDRDQPQNRDEALMTLTERTDNPPSPGKGILAICANNRISSLSVTLPHFI
jgi:hypothetical protein